MIWVRDRWDDLASPVAANQVAAGAFFFGEHDHPGSDKPCCCYVSCRKRFFLSVKMTTQDLTSLVAAMYLAAGAIFW